MSKSGCAFDSKQVDTMCPDIVLLSAAHFLLDGVDRWRLITRESSSKFHFTNSKLHYHQKPPSKSLMREAEGQ